MRIGQLTLTDFRNYVQAAFAPEPGVNLIVGENAQGKTNLLEAVFTCCFGRSHRTGKEREMIRYGQDCARIQLVSEKTGVRHKLQMVLSQSEGRRIRLDGEPLRRVGELMGRINCVLFAPEHLSIVKDGPAERRRFLDMELSQTYPAYFYTLQQYQRVLRQRNNLLKTLREKPQLGDTLPVWDEQLAALGAQLILERDRFCNRLSALAQDNHLDISGGRERLGVRYQPNIPAGDPTALLDALTASRDEDMRRGTTTAGPHRDELTLLLDGKEIRAYGSQGQQRTAALALKLSELDLIRKETGEWPVLMLDDVMSELDERRQSYLLERILPVQALVTSASGQLDRWPKAAVFRVQNGVVTKA